MTRAANEPLRKSIHIAFGLFALTLKWLPWWMGAIAAIAAILANWLVLDRMFRGRVARHERGWDAGVLLYPFAVLLLILVFRNAIHYAAVAWVLLAFGDGVATLAGRAMPFGRLPWNADKSWGGFLAFLVAGGASALAVAYWFGYHEPGVVLLATLVAAFAESLRTGIDDNFIVPFAAAAALIVAGIQPLSPYGAWPASHWWLIANGVLALLGFFTRSVDLSGAVGGWVLGAILILGAGWPLYVTLLAFFVLGTLATKLGYSRKARAGLAQEKGGRRGFSHAFANTGVAAICAIAVSRLARSAHGDVELQLLPLFMGVASLATAAADTVSSEVGQLLGKRAFLPLTLRRVPVGTDGAVSVEGTLAGALGGFLVAAAGVAATDAMYFEGLWSWKLVGVLTLCAFAGAYLESIVGSRWHVPNGVLNFFNTAAGAILFYYLQGPFGLFDWDALLRGPLGKP